MSEANTTNTPAVRRRKDGKPARASRLSAWRRGAEPTVIVDDPVSAAPEKQPETDPTPERAAWLARRSTPRHRVGTPAEIGTAKPRRKRSAAEQQKRRDSSRAKRARAAREAVSR